MVSGNAQQTVKPRYPPWLQKALQRREFACQYWQAQHNAMSKTHSMHGTASLDLEENAAIGFGNLERTQTPMGSLSSDSIWQQIASDNVVALEDYLSQSLSTRLFSRLDGKIFAGGSGETLLHYAALHAATQCTNMLLDTMQRELPVHKHHALVNAIDTCYSGSTPLISVCQSFQGDEERRVQVAHSLLMAGASIECQDAHGDTALHWCSRNLHIGLLRLLTQYATPTIVNTHNLKHRTAYDLAKQQCMKRPCRQTSICHDLLFAAASSTALNFRVQMTKHQRQQQQQLVESSIRIQNEKSFICESASNIVSKCSDTWKAIMAQAQKNRQLREDTFIQEAEQEGFMEWVRYIESGDASTRLSREGKSLLDSRRKRTSALMNRKSSDSTLEKLAVSDEKHKQDFMKDIRKQARADFRQTSPPYPTETTEQLRDALFRK